jgi:hypothetical protein
MLQRQGIGRCMGVHWPVSPRLGWKGNHQLNGLLAGRGPCALGAARAARYTGRHYRRPQRKSQLACCRIDAASRGA